MNFVNKMSNRNPRNWFAAAMMTVLGLPLTLIMGIDIIYNGDFDFLLGLIVGLSFLAVGTYLFYLIIVAKEFTRIVSTEMIICKSNGVVIHQFKKEDIKTIEIWSQSTQSVKFRMRNNGTLKLNHNYWMNLASFYQELMMCGYKASYC